MTRRVKISARQACHLLRRILGTLRGMHLLPRQGDREPWQHSQDYWTDKDTLPAADLDDGTLEYR